MVLPNWLLWGSLALLTGGLTLLVRGWRHRRRTADPHCPHCEYNLAGIDADRCPECGAPSTRERRPHSVRQRHTGMLVTGAIVLLGGLGLAVPGLMRVNWYAYQPTAWLLDDLRTGNPKSFFRAWAVISARDDAGRLSDRILRELIAVALAEQATQTNPFASDKLIEFLGDCHAADRLLPDEAKQFYEQLFTVTLEIRPHVAQGAPLPIRLAHTGRGPQGFTARAQWDSIDVGGQPWPFQNDSSWGCSFRSSGSNGITFPTTFGDGRYPVRIDVAFSARPPGSQEPLHEWQVELKGEFTVGGAASVVSAYVDEALIADLRKRTQIELGSNWIQLPPTRQPVAFDILLKTDAGEQQVSRIATPRVQSNHSYGFHVPREAGPIQAIILRGSATAAAHSIDVFRYLDCELVFDRETIDQQAAERNTTAQRTGSASRDTTSPIP